MIRGEPLGGFDLIEGGLVIGHQRLPAAGICERRQRSLSAHPSRARSAAMESRDRTGSIFLLKAIRTDYPELCQPSSRGPQRTGVR